VHAERVAAFAYGEVVVVSVLAMPAAGLPCHVSASGLMKAGRGAPVPGLGAGSSPSLVSSRLGTPAW
jgi:hypothetical protein